MESEIGHSVVAVLNELGNGRSRDQKPGWIVALRYSRQNGSESIRKGPEKSHNTTSVRVLLCTTSFSQFQG